MNDLNLANTQAETCSWLKFLGMSVQPSRVSPDIVPPPQSKTPPFTQRKTLRILYTCSISCEKPVDVQYPGPKDVVV